MECRSRPSRCSGAIAILTGVLILLTQNSAVPLTGADDVDADDIGARASVALYDREGFLCGGTVVADSFIITAAHCFVRDDGRQRLKAEDVRVFYGTSLEGGNFKRGMKLAIHENYADEARLAYRASAQGYWVPQIWDDIAILKIQGTHPAGSIGAFLPDIENDFTSSKGNIEFPEGDALWYYLYGYSAQGDVRLQSALTGQYGPLTKVIPGKKPQIIGYNPQSFFIVFLDDSVDSEISVCSGDSGSGLFLAKSDGLSYSPDRDREAPKGGIQLKDGRPVLIALLRASSVENPDEAAGNNCGRDTNSTGIHAVRIDYYYDWISSKMKQMQ